MKIEVEVENAEDLEEAIACGADVIMLDNQDPETLRDLVSFARALRSVVLLEASGGVSIDNVGRLLRRAWTLSRRVRSPWVLRRQICR